MRMDDVDDLLAIFSDPKVMASFGGMLLDRSDMERWTRRNVEHQERYGYGLFAVIHRGDRRLIGDCGLEVRREDGPEVELGYDFRSDYWGHGYATEAASAVRDYAFRQLRIPRLVSMIRRGNEASRRVAERIGMRYEADVTQHGVDYWVYALARGAPIGGSA